MKNLIPIILIFSVLTFVNANDNPFDNEIQNKITVLQSGDTTARARAVEALGYMRAYKAENALIAALSDESAEVRRRAALSLAWCGSRAALKPLLQKLDDSDWTVRQSAGTALENLTGMNFPFDALGNLAARKQVVAQWENGINALPDKGIPDYVLQQIRSPDHCKVVRSLRAVGALGLDAATVKLIAETLEPWKKNSNEEDSDAKIRVQTALRTLGRSGVPEAFPVLCDFLRNPQWTRYAADALGDFGGDDAASVLMDVFPQHARQLTDKNLFGEHIIKAAATHPSDVPHLDSRDRILAVPYAILFSLSRIEFNDPQLTERLKQLAPLIAQQIPLDIDRLAFYEEEPFQKIFRALLIRAGEKENFLNHAFASLTSCAALTLPLPTNSSFNSNLLLTLCREPSEVPRIVPFLEHPNHWVRINAAKTLLFIGDKQAIPVIRQRLAESKREADYGEIAPPPYNDNATKQGQDEFNDPTPRDREALIMALGGFRDVESVPLLIRILNDDKNSLGIQHRSALALDKIGSAEALAALQEAERSHPYHSVRIAAREALWRHNVSPLPRLPVPPLTPVSGSVNAADIPQRVTRFVFIKGNIVPDNNPFQMDSWRQAYMTTDSGPTYRPGNNLYVLDITDGKPVVQPLTNFTDGYVADCEVSYDGKTIWFSRREQKSSWWHVFRLNLTQQADSSNPQQITHGPYHDVQPVELPSGRIAFSSTRLGTRDEYHGYLATGLSTMTPDGRDIQVVGFNFGRDSEPAVADNGSILITRLELFYSRMKTEYNLLALHPDGTQAQTLYGPERRAFWRQIHGGYGGWFAGGETGGRHRLLRLTQPQPFSAENILLTTPAGPVLTQGRNSEKLLRQSFLRQGGNDEMVITTAIRLDDKTLLVAAGKKNKEMEKAQFPKDPVALGIYTMDIATGNLTLLYDDPTSSCYEARALHPRIVPPVIPEDPASRGAEFTGTLYAQSVFHSQESRVRTLGKLLRVVEGLPQVTRHATQTTPGEFAWKNHGGAFGRDLGIIPLAADGSFAVEVPADRFLSLQVLDSDRNVVGNQLIWMNVRPGENKGCIGCHESADTAVPPRPSLALRVERPVILPSGEPFQFQAKVWFKGHLPDEREERQRTVQSANWFGRP